MDGSLTAILPIMDLLNRVIIPCVVISITTSLLIHSIYKMRILSVDFTMRMSISNTNWANKQVALVFNSIALNLVFIMKFEIFFVSQSL
jgi:succinate dehydrogenase/fumarate reductase cytochrome b subunit